MLNELMIMIKRKFCFDDKNINGYKICNANIYKRIVAFLIDLLIISLTVTVFLSFSLKKYNIDTEAIKQVEQESVKQEEEAKALVKKVFNTILLTTFLYFFISNIYIKSTIGQKILKLRIISVNNSNITNYEIFNKALFTAFIITIMNIYILIIFFVIPLLLTNYKVTLLDMITNTSIIEIKNLE